MGQFPERPNQEPSRPQGRGGYDSNEFNFAQGPMDNQTPFGYDFGTPIPTEQPRRSGFRRTLLLGCGFLSFVVIACCACIFGTTYFFREAVPATLWIQMATDNGEVLDLSDAVELNVVCEGSQAELFTQRFLETYPGDVTIEFEDNTQLSGDDNTVGFEGTFTYNGETFPYEATFHINPDGDGVLPFVGCIERIDQFSPPLSVELPSETDTSGE